MEKLNTDIRKTDRFMYTNDLGMFYFYFQKQKDEEDTLIVHADRGWWNYQAEITFNRVLFSNCPAELDPKIICRLATEEEEKHLRRLHDYPFSYKVYCFEDISKYYINNRLVSQNASDDSNPEFVKNALSLIQQKKSFVIAQSVKVVAFFSDRSFDETFSLWQKGDISDLSEAFQNVFLSAIDASIRFAKSVAEKKRVNHPHPDSNEQI